MGEPVEFTPSELEGIVEAAVLIVDAIRDDEPNPAVSPFLERLEGMPGAWAMRESTLREAIDALTNELDKFAIALLSLGAGERGARIGIRAAMPPVKTRLPGPGEVLAPERRASWARERTEHDAPVTPPTPKPAPTRVPGPGAK
jgi:hypothetical protein